MRVTNPHGVVVIPTQPDRTCAPLMAGASSVNINPNQCRLLHPFVMTPCGCRGEISVAPSDSPSLFLTAPTFSSAPISIMMRDDCYFQILVRFMPWNEVYESVPGVEINVLTFELQNIFSVLLQSAGVISFAGCVFKGNIVDLLTPTPYTPKPFPMTTKDVRSLNGELWSSASGECQLSTTPQPIAMGVAIGGSIVDASSKVFITHDRSFTRLGMNPVDFEARARFVQKFYALRS